MGSGKKGKKKIIRLAAATAALGALSACTIQQSGNLKTSAIQVRYTIAGDSRSGATASAQFTEADTTGVGVTYLQLSDGDSVSVNGAAMSQTDPYLVTYGAPVAYQVGATYTFTFTRTGESPYVSSVTLPDPVAITAPSDGASLSRGQAIPVSWSKGATSTDKVVVSMTTNGDTVGGYFSQSLMPDPGAVTIGGSYTTTAPTGAYTAPSGPTPPTTGTITVSRERAGSMPAGLSGSVAGVQRAAVNVTFQ